MQFLYIRLLTMILNTYHILLVLLQSSPDPNIQTGREDEPSYQLEVSTSKRQSRCQ